MRRRPRCTTRTPATTSPRRWSPSTSTTSRPTPGQRDGARVAAAFDEAQGAKWESLSGKPGVQAQARAQVAEWTRRFGGRKFLLAPALAHTLTLDHAQILEGAQAP